MSTTSLDVKNHQTKREAAYLEVKRRIETGFYQPGQQLPKEQDFADELGISKISLAPALQRLQDEGLVVRIKSKGSFVTDKAGRKIIIETVRTGLSENTAVISIQKAVERFAATVNTEVVSIPFSLLNDPNCRESIAERIGTIGAAGVICFGSNFVGDEPIMSLLKQSNVPVVIPNATQTDNAVTGFATMSMPHSQAWEAAIKHLFSQGHSRIFTVLSEKTRERSFRGFTLDKYNKLLEGYGADIRHCSVIYQDLDIGWDEKAFMSALDNGSSPTAVMCMSDRMAVSVFHTLKKFGRQVPDDIAVMGYGGLPIGMLLDQGLSTIDFSYEKIGQRAVELILRADEWFEKTRAPQLINDFKLKADESTSAMRSELKLHKAMK
ncbi:MAG: substrate-binding domain-containing protein [Planctomycetota bacterium]